MQIADEIQRLYIGILAFLLLIGTSVAYWVVSGEQSVLLRDDNPRLVEFEESILRGTIVDRNHVAIAESRVLETGTVIRQYANSALSSVLGYASLRYGTSNVEALYDELLRGDVDQNTWQTFVEQDLLHRAPVGVDIQLTIDASLQSYIVEQLQPIYGAAIVLSVPNGEVLSLVSLPTYDANTLDANWETLIQEDGNPFTKALKQG